MAITIAIENPLQDDVRGLVAELNAHLLKLSPPEHCYHLTVEQMAAPGVTVWVARDGGEAIGCGALKRHSKRIAEVKRMFTRESHRGQGIGRRLLGEILNAAIGEGIEELVLETGDRPEGSTLSKDGSKLYVAHRDADKVVIIDTIAWRIVGEIPTGKSPVRCGLASNEEVLVYALFGDSAVGFADIASRTETGRIPVAGPAVSLEMHDDETALTCAQEQDVCYVVSAAERRILHEVKVRRGANPDPALLLEP